MNNVLLLLCLMTATCSATKKRRNPERDRQKSELAIAAKLAEKDNRLMRKSCVICREELGDLAHVTDLACAKGVHHPFHIPCIMPWINEHHNCPTCRRKTPGSPIDCTSSTSRMNSPFESLRNFIAIMYGGEEDLDPERRNNILIAMNDVRPNFDDDIEGSDHEYGLLLGLHTLLLNWVNTPRIDRFSDMQNVRPIDLRTFPTNFYEHWKNCATSSHVSGIEDSKLDKHMNTLAMLLSREHPRTLENGFVPNQFVVPTITNYQRLAAEDRSQNNRS